MARKLALTAAQNTRITVASRKLGYTNAPDKVSHVLLTIAGS